MGSDSETKTKVGLTTASLPTVEELVSGRIVRVPLWTLVRYPQQGTSDLPISFLTEISDEFL